MKESFGAEGNSCTIPATWNGTTWKRPVRWSSTRSRSRSPLFSEKSVIVSLLTRIPSGVERSRASTCWALEPMK